MEKNNRKTLLIIGGIVLGGLTVWALYRYFHPSSHSDSFMNNRITSKGSISYLEKSDIIRMLVTIKERAQDELKFLTNLYKKQRRDKMDNKKEYVALVRKMQA